MQLPIRLITLSLMFGVFLGIVAIPTVAKSQSESVGSSENSFTLPSLNHFQLSEREEEWLANHQKVRIGTMNAWPPMDFVDTQGRPQGIGARFIEALMGITPRPEREAFFHFTKPYVTVPHAIFARNDSPYLNDLADLKGKSVGVEQGFFIIKVLHDNYPEVEVKEYNSTSDALDAVAKGDVDTYIGNRAVAIYIIETELISNIQQHGKITETSSINAIGVRKDWPILRDILQKALNSLTDEEMRAIMQEWVDIPKSSYALLLNNDEQRWLESKTEIRVATMDTWPPFNFVESDGTPTGIGSDIIAALNLRLEGKLKIVPGAWKEIYDKVKEERLDAIMDITPKAEREEFFNFTKPYLDVPHVIVAPSNATYITNEDGLEGKILALEKGFGNVKYFKQHYPNITIKEYRDTAHALDAVVRGEVNADGWPKVMTDRKRLMQCLLNYLINSVKFTEQGKVTLNVSVKSDRVEISVTDTGIGIAEEDLPKLFEAFERLETHLRVKAGGSGLGLYLTKKIAEELLHGSVSVESRINEGSTFRLEIPVSA